MNKLLFVIYATAWDYMGTAVDGKLYTVTYSSDPKSFEENCIVAQKMVDSFEIKTIGKSNEESGSGPALICNPT